MMRHVNTRIATLLSLPHPQLAAMFDGPTADVIKELEERKAAGEIFLPCEGCIGFDPVKGCPGHEKNIPGSTDATGLFTAKNPYHCERMSNYTCFELPEASICDGCKKNDEYDRAHPPLFCYNENNELVKGVEGLEVKGPVWQAFTIADEKNDNWDWFNCIFPHGEYAQHGIETRQVYIAVQPTEKAAVSNVEEIENSVRELIKSLPGYEANVKLQQFYKAIYEAGRKQGATDQEKLMQVDWVKVSELEALVDRLKNPNGFIECTPYGLITEIKKLRNKQQ